MAAWFEAEQPVQKVSFRPAFLPPQVERASPLHMPVASPELVALASSPEQLVRQAARWERALAASATLAAQASSRNLGTTSVQAVLLVSASPRAVLELVLLLLEERRVRQAAEPVLPQLV
jgi:hypothetical protein